MLYFRPGNLEYPVLETEVEQIMGNTLISINGDRLNQCLTELSTIERIVYRKENDETFEQYRSWGYMTTSETRR
jgi:hypothetical protein